MSAKGANSIQVCIKVRPCEPGCSSLWQVKEGRSIQLADSHAEPSVFDYVFDEGAGNQEVFDRMAQHIVRACMQGFNGTIFAYGQTSSGKTYTMMGDGQNPGVMVLAAKEIFQQIANETERDFLLRVGYIEIYNEKIYDLLNKKNQDLKIHEAGHGIVNVNCEECIITSEDDLLRLLSLGNKERTVGETNMNERSSRSHAIFRIIIESRKSDRTDDDAVIQSVLNLVDLAGSERADQTGATGARLKEGAHINKSLMFLSNVIKNLSENVDNKFISFRDSKLTRILQASLGGNAFTSIICTIKPSIMEESQSTLNFAMRAKKIRIKPQVNEMVSDATMMKRLEREIKTLKSQLAEEKRKKESQLTVQDLERRLKTDMLKIISSTSLSDQRQQKRRRTWCPAPTGQDASLPALSGILNESRLIRPSNLSNLPKPTFFATSNIAYREKMVPKTINILSSLDITTNNDGGINENFVPAECVNFDTPPTSMWHPNIKPKSRKLPDLALTPVPNPMGPETVEKIKKEIEELQTFTSLEKHFDVEWTEVQVLKENLEKMTAQRDQLEQDCLTKTERCEVMQREVTNLTVATESANSKIAEYEKELKALKETIAKMDLENREAISLEFQFEAYKKKSSLREKDLLSALSEKELTIQNLQKNLDDLSRDMTRNSKEALMRSMCPNPADFGDITLNETDVNEDSKKVDCECDRLRSEIIASQAKLERIQSDFDMAVSETSQKKEDCQRLSAQISKAQADFELLQGKYESQQEAIETMQADFQAIQQKYHNLQEEYESLERSSKASETECQQLQADNKSLQLEIGALKERVEEAQRQLLEASSQEALAEVLKAQSNELKAKLAEMTSNFNAIQEEYDNLSSQLMESVQENDALRNELKQRSLPSYGLESMRSSGVDSMKSSGVETEFGEQEHEAVSLNDLFEHFAKLSESIHQIELKNHLGLSRLFVVSKPEKEQENNVTALKLCLESAKHIECETHQAKASEGIPLKGLIKQQVFQLVALSQEQLEAGEDKRLLKIITQLEQEIKDKNEVMEATEATINEMREQMTVLESELMEKSLIVNKVEGYQRQIESLEKQNAEITMVYEELQDKVHRNSTMSESLLPNDDTISGSHESFASQPQEDASHKAFLAELQAKVCELQAEVESQLKQMQLKDKNIAELKAEIEEMGERCLSSEVKLVEMENDAREKQQLLDRQIQKLSDDALLIDQLQEKNAKLQERNIKAEELQATQEQKIPSSEYEKQIEELRVTLSRVQDELITMEKLKTDEINALQLEYLAKMERSENENRAKFRGYTQELEENKDRYESDLATLRKTLLKTEEELSRLKDRCKAEPEENRVNLQEILSQMEEERQKVFAQHQAELEATRKNLQEKLGEAEAKAAQQQSVLEEITESLKKKLAEAEAKAAKQQTELKEITKNQKENYADSETNAAEQQAKLEAATESLKKKLAEAEAKADQHQAELKATTETLKEKLDEAKAKTGQQLAELDAITQTLNEKLAEAEEKQAYINDIMGQRDTREAAVAHLESDLDKLKMENKQLLEQLQSQAGNGQLSEYIASSNKIQELADMCDQQALDLNNREQEKINLQTEISEANEQYLSIKNKLQKLAMQMDAQTQKQLLSEKDFEEQRKVFTAKISELEEALQSAQLNAASHNDLVLKHKELMASSNGKIQELQGKYEQQLRDIDTLRQEKSILQVRIDEADAQHSSTLNKLHELERQMNNMSHQKVIEKSDFEEKLQTMTEKISDLETQLQSARLSGANLDNLIVEHESLKLSLSKATEVSSTLQEKIESLQLQLLASKKDISSRDLQTEELRADLKLALEAKNTASAEQLGMTTKLQAVEEKMATQTRNFEKELAELNSATNELQVKLKSLQEQNDELMSENSELKVKLKKADNLQNQLEDEQKLCASLRTQFAELEEAKSRLEDQLRHNEAEVNRKFQEVELGRHSIGILTQECDKLRSDLLIKTKSFRKEMEVLESTISSLAKEKQLLEEKISTLNNNNIRNADLIAKLRAQEAESEAMREASISQKLAAEAADVKCRQFKEQNLELEKEMEQLRTTLKSKETSILAERESMSATISSLLENKRNLEEKQCTLDDIVTKLEAELSALHAHKSNSSFESNTSTGSVPRKSLDRNPTASFPRKSACFESEMRKSRRLSAYDEHRRQSYWNDVRDCSTMTDPVDTNCNCTELDSKLQACQQDLFIRESQVTALNMELKHHPLKDENAQLKKRVLEEQEKARSEQKRLKMKIQDLNAKVNDLSNAAKSTPAQVPEPKPSLVTPSASVHTQTELDQLEKKYQDALVLLRSRYHLIKDLEEKLNQNENTDTSNVSSLTSGKIHSLTKQCESLKKELAAVREKYETSKRVLMMRKDEMIKMREKLAAFESAAAAPK